MGGGSSESHWAPLGAIGPHWAPAQRSSWQLGGPIGVCLSPSASQWRSKASALGRLVGCRSLGGLVLAGAQCAWAAARSARRPTRRAHRPLERHQSDCYSSTPAGRESTGHEHRLLLARARHWRARQRASGASSNGRPTRPAPQRRWEN